MSTPSSTPWHPQDILCALKKLGYTQQQIADEVGVSRSTVSITLHAGSSKVVREWIASTLGYPVEVIWPSRAQPKSKPKPETTYREASGLIDSDWRCKG